MGDKRVSTRTLADGYRVRHSPPDAEHPAGRLDLIRDRSPLRERLNAALQDNKDRQEALHEVHRQRIAAKRDAQVAKDLPAEKSHH